MKDNSLICLRGQIDEIDEELCVLLKKRFSVCREIKKIKEKNGLNVTDGSRESAVYAHVSALFDLPEEKDAAHKIYGAIISGCKDLQK